MVHQASNRHIQAVMNKVHDFILLGCEEI